jgi:carboxypeptidase family protein
MFLASRASRARSTFVACVLCCVGSIVGAAAADSGSIRGVVVETSGGAPIRGVSVRLRSSGRTVLTDDEGRFEIGEVPPGEHELYVSAVDFILVKRKVTVAADGVADVTIALTDGTGAYAETVDVSARPPMTRHEPGVAGEQTLGSRELQQLRGTLTNDPLRAVQSLPAVAAGDDFRSEFAVRAAGPQQMTFTFEGIATPFLLHTVQQVHDSGSIAMVNGDVLDEVTLLTGAYPQRHGNRTGAEVDFRMREGSRDRMQTHLSVSAIDASGVAEGPIGSAKRGSWLVSARKSYLNLIVDRLYPDQNVSFGFVDAQAKAAYDINTRHQVQVAMTAGVSRFGRDPSLIGAGNLRDADNRSTMTVGTWRYVPSATATLTQRVAAVQNTFRNVSRDGVDLDSGDAHDLVYRADLSSAPSAGTLVEAGGELRRSTVVGREQRLANGRFQLRDAFNSTAIASSAYGQIRLTHTPRPQASDDRPAAAWSITPGARVDYFSLSGRASASPWLLGVAPIGRRLSVRGGIGVHRQEPEAAEMLGTRGSRGLRPERAYHADVGIEGRIGSTARWQMTVYNREDRDLLRLPQSEMRVANGLLLNASLTTTYVNALDGTARGVEWLVERHAANGFSGWASYAFGSATYRDRTTGERFWGDFDQRHTVNLYGTYRTSDRLSFSARFRAGTNFPTTGYWTERDGGYFVGTERNTIRVPAYSRMDVRANRTFTWDRRRLTLFVEAINLLGNDNVRFALPSIDRRTFEATNLYERMVPRIPSVGVLLEF